VIASTGKASSRRTKRTWPPEPNRLLVWTIATVVACLAEVPVGYVDLYGLEPRRRELGFFIG
jgi:hypothetical protein